MPYFLPKTRGLVANSPVPGCSFRYKSASGAVPGHIWEAAMLHFVSQQRFLGIQPAAKSGQVTAAAYDPVAGNDDGYRVVRAG